MNKNNLDNVLKKAVHFSEYSSAWKILLPMVLVNKFLLDNTEAFYLSKYGLLRSEVDVLGTLYFNDKTLSPTELYEAMLFSSGGMTKVLKKLEEKKLISRIPSETDKRSLLVKIEYEGEKVIEEALSAAAEYQSKFFDVLDENEKKVIENAFKKLAYASLVDAE